MWMKRIRIIFAVLFLIIAAAGCTKKKTNDALAAALEDIKPALSLMDQRYTLIQTALDAAVWFLDNPSEENRAEARKSCVDSISALSSFTSAESGLSKEEQRSLVKLGLNLADYQVPFEMEAYSRASSVTDLSVLLCQLENEPVAMEAFGQSLKLLRRNNAVFRQVDYLCLNELFCQFQGGDIDAFKEEFLPSLETLSSDGLPWDTDSSALEARANMLMDSAEADLEAYAEFVGKQYAELLALQKNIGTILNDAGYGESDNVQALLEQGLEGIAE